MSHGYRYVVESRSRRTGFEGVEIRTPSPEARDPREAFIRRAKLAQLSLGRLQNSSEKDVQFLSESEASGGCPFFAPEKGTKVAFSKTESLTVEKLRRLGYLKNQDGKKQERGP